MSVRERIDEHTVAGEGPLAPAAKRPYEAPRLVRYGDVRDVTLGPSPGTGESGAPLSLHD